MTTTLIVGGVLVVLLIALIAITIMVLIKQFKNGGPLHGSIGLVTLGVWTFIWGWMKHKGLYLTKVMIVWTALIITPMALIGVFGFGTVSELMAVATNLTGDKKEVKKISSKQSTQPKKASKSSKKPARKTTYKKTAYSTKKTARKTTYKKPSRSPINSARKSATEQYHHTLSNEPQR